MTEQIDELIDSLNALKTEKQKHIEEQTNTLRGFNLGNENIVESSGKILSHLNHIQEEMKVYDENKKEFWRNFKPLDSEEGSYKEKNQIKKFKFRESPLTEAMKKDSYQTIYNIFLSFLVFLMGIFVMSEYIENDNIFNFNVFGNSLKGIGSYMQQWVLKVIISAAFVIYIQILKDIGSNTNSSIIFYTSLVLLMYSFKFVFNTENMSFLFRVVHFCDNTTLILKLISYFNEKVLHVSYGISKRAEKENNRSESTKDDVKDGQLSSSQEHDMSILIKDDGVSEKVLFEFKKVNLVKEIKSFLFFYVAPTLVYRDVYPSNNKISFIKMIKHSINILMSLIFFVLIFETEINPMFNEKNRNNVNMNKNTLIQTLVGFIIFSMMLFFMLFFGITHSFLNLYAEMTKFGDRHFYGCFYSAKSPLKFYQRLTMYYEDFLKSYFKIKCGKFAYEVIRIMFFCFLGEYIFLNATGLTSPFISVIIILTHAISYPFNFFKTEKKVLVNWLIMSLAMGLVVMVSYIDYYIAGSRQVEHVNKFVPKMWYLIKHKLY